MLHPYTGWGVGLYNIHMEIIKTYTRCGQCGGDGVKGIDANTPVEIDPCPSCNGEGYHEAGKVGEVLGDFLDDLSDKVDDILDKVNDIKEKLDE